MEKRSSAPERWLNRNVFAFGLTSLLSDFFHEMATAILPQFMQAIGATAAMLGFIEGIADALASFIKLGAGYHSDKIGRRKGWTAIGPSWGFFYAAAVGLTGTVCMFMIPRTPSPMALAKGKTGT